MELFYDLFINIEFETTTRAKKKKIKIFQKERTSKTDQLNKRVVSSTIYFILCE